jgi:2-polyprenyl-3-methyl-5-hydroxy-6-metoxy-1,4-benzoquinol methylase
MVLRLITETKELLEPDICDLCGSDSQVAIMQVTDRRSGSDNVFSLVSCTSCGLVSLRPLPKLRELSNYYSKEYSPYRIEVKDIDIKTRSLLRNRYDIFRQKFWYAQFSQPSTITQKVYSSMFLLWVLYLRINGRFNVYPPIPSEGRRALDFGCGSGWYLRSLREIGWEAIGIEWNPEIAQKAAVNSGCTVYPGTLPGVPLESASFDYISIWHVLEHVPSPSATIAEIARLIKPGGYLFLALPNFSSLERRFLGSDWYAIDVPRHLYHFNHLTIQRLLAQHGFVVNTQWKISESWGLRLSLTTKFPRKSLGHYTLQSIAGIAAKALSLLNLGGYLLIFCQKI